MGAACDSTVDVTGPWYGEAASRRSADLDPPALALPRQLDADHIEGHALVETATREHSHESACHPGIGGFVAEVLAPELLADQFFGATTLGGRIDAAQHRRDHLFVD